MDVEASAVPAAPPVAEGGQRRGRRWAVSVQAKAPRPAACKGCGETFEEQDLRLCLWSQRARGQFYHIACCRDACPADSLEALGSATAANVDEVRASLAAIPQTAAGDVEMSGRGDDVQQPLQNAWSDRSLPRRAFWEQFSWESLLRLGRSTWVQVPDRFHSAVEHARRQALEALAEARESGGTTEPEWKCALLFDLLLLSRMPADGSCAEALEERLAWWAGAQWEALWGAVVGPPTQPPAKTTTTKKARADRVHTLAASGEEGRALAAVSAEPPAPRTEKTYDSLCKLFPARPDAEAALPAALAFDAGFQEEVAKEVQKLLKRPPKLTAPGLFGTRLEHLAASANDPRTRELLCWAAALLATGDAPTGVFQALRRGEVVGLAKSDGGVRPLVIGACMRRLALRAVVRVRKEAVAAAAGAHQYGVGRPAGADRIARSLRVLAEARPDAVFIKLDLKTAFQLMSRGLAASALTEACPELTNTFRAWYDGSTDHWWRTAAGTFEEIGCHTGFDQGCPLAAAAFAAGLCKALEPFWPKARAHDPHVRLYAYLDDMYVVCSRDASLAVLCALEEALTAVGLKLNPGKTQLWCPSGVQGIPRTLPGKRVPTLGVLGAALKAAGDTEEAPVAAHGAGTALLEATQKLSNL